MTWPPRSVTCARAWHRSSCAPSTSAAVRPGKASISTMSPASTTVSGMVSAASLLAMTSQLRPETVVRSGGRCRSLIAITLPPAVTVTSSRSETSARGEVMTIQFLPPQWFHDAPRAPTPTRRGPQTVALFPKRAVWLTTMVRRHPGPGRNSYQESGGSNVAGVSRIYHIATRADWEQALRDGVYTRSSVDKTLAEEGFIHASQASQVTRTANRFYRDVPGDLVVLVIDTSLLRAKCRYEDVPGADLPSPRIYGPLNVDAVLAAEPLPAGPDG